MNKHWRHAFSATFGTLMAQLIITPPTVTGAICGWLLAFGVLEFIARNDKS